jgi:predicted nucleic-acid-binding protein
MGGNKLKSYVLVELVNVFQQKYKPKTEQSISKAVGDKMFSNRNINRKHFQSFVEFEGICENSSDSTGPDLA